MFTCNGSEPKDVLKGLLKIEQYLYLKNDIDREAWAQMSKALEDVISYMNILDKLDSTNNMIITSRCTGKTLWCYLLEQTMEKDHLIKELKVTKDIKPLTPADTAYIMSQHTPASAYEWLPWLYDIYNNDLIVAKLIKKEDQ